MAWRRPSAGPPRSHAGRAWTTAALERGDRVAATARDTTTLTDLVGRFGEAILPIQLDVNDRAAGITAVQAAHRHFGRLDVVVNNAGFGHFGAIEEITEDEARAQRLRRPVDHPGRDPAAARAGRRPHRAGLQHRRGYRVPPAGHLQRLQVGLEGFTEALAQEVAPFGIKTTLIEPSGFATDWAGSSAAHSAPNPLYQPVRDMFASWGDATTPTADDSVEAVFQAVDAAEPPTRLLLASMGYDMVLATHEQRIATWQAWEKTARSADPKPAA